MDTGNAGNTTAEQWAQLTVSIGDLQTGMNTLAMAFATMKSESDIMKGQIVDKFNSWMHSVGKQWGVWKRLSHS